MMKSLIESLAALQELQLKGAKAASGAGGEREKLLRTEIPESFLQIFDRFTQRNRKAVSTVRHGVCSECHIQIAVGTLGTLAFGHGVQQCGNCGRFLFLPKDEPVFGMESHVKSKVIKTRKSPAASRSRKEELQNRS
jgi:predicted  nucleic acid-binding Zn-ribbon protein